MVLTNNHPYRQTHLDFHTSPDIPGIGSRFSKENFQAALKKGNLDSITVFAKCHHGVCYYPTDVGIRHPHLDFDLTGAMIEAAHEIGVRAPIYITAGWSDEDAVRNPQWRAVNRDGTYMANSNYDFAAGPDVPKPHCDWIHMCLNDGSYAHHIYDLTEEICRRYDKVDGLFYDICIIGAPCHCQDCVKGMLELGMDPDNEEHARQYYILKRQVFMKTCNEILQRYHPGATIFFNSGGADMNKPEFHDLQSHYEMEDLPTAWGGYDKLPLRAKFFRKLGKASLGMTGKFHLDWGEFGGFKTKEALKFEIATMALYGVGASVGDHMHPDGEMELQTYENIGFAYTYLEQIAPFCYGGENTAKLGICLSPDDAANEGLSNILLENQIDYDIVMNWDFQRYETVILPEKTVLDDNGIAALEAYLAQGGKLVCIADALVKDGKFQVDIGMEYLGKPEFDCDYLVPVEWNETLPNAPMLCNIPGHKVRVEGAQVLAELMTPYFSRTYSHFCGHRNTPHNKDSQRYPGIAKKGNVVYLAHSLPKDYFCNGCVFNKRYFMLALSLVYKPDLQVTGLGAQGRCTMIHQPDQSRYCINMVYASPVRRGRAEIIEDILPVYNIGVTLKLQKPVCGVRLGLTGEALSYTQEAGVLRFCVPELNCHTSIVVEYGK